MVFLKTRQIYEKQASKLLFMWSGLHIFIRTAASTVEKQNLNKFTRNIS